MNTPHSLHTEQSYNINHTLPLPPQENELKDTICRLKAEHSYKDLVNYLLDILETTPLHKDMCARLYNELGLAYLQVDESEEAKAAFEAAMEANPDCVNAHFNRANLALYARTFQEGRALFQAVLDLEPRHAGALHHLGLCLAMLDKHAEALPYFERSAHILYHTAHNQDCEESMGPLFWAAESLVHLKEFSKALPYFQRAVKLMPEHQESLRGIAICQFHTAHYEACLSTCEDLLRMGKGAEFMAFRIKGDALLELNRAEEAAYAHLELLRLDFDARHYAAKRHEELVAKDSPLAPIYHDIITKHIPLLDAEFLHQE